MTQTTAVSGGRSFGRVRKILGTAGWLLNPALQNANGLNGMLRIYSKRFAVLVEALRMSESTFYSQLAFEYFLILCNKNAGSLIF